MRALALPVAAVTRPAPGYVEISLETEGAIEAAPGQFFMLRAGDSPDTYLPRAFSWYRAQEGTLSFLLRVEGPGTQQLGRLRAGDVVPVLGPLGKGFPLPERPVRAALLGGGVGVPPLWGLARSLIGQGSQAVAILGARNKEHLLGEAELAALGAEVRVATDDGSLGHHGPLTDLLGDAGWDVLYACGPEGMLRRVQEISLRGGPPAFLALEAPMACGYGVCLGCVVERRSPDPALGDYGRYVRVCREGPVFAAQEVSF